MILDRQTNPNKYIPQSLVPGPFWGYTLLLSLVLSKVLYQVLPSGVLQEKGFTQE